MRFPSHQISRRSNFWDGGMDLEWIWNGLHCWDWMGIARIEAFCGLKGSIHDFGLVLRVLPFVVAICTESSYDGWSGDFLGWRRIYWGGNGGASI